MEEMKGKEMTPEEKTALKDEVLKAVEDVFAGETMSKHEIIMGLEGAIESLKGPQGPGLKGLGAEAEGGMKLPEEGGQEGEE